MHQSNLIGFFYSSFPAYTVLNEIESPHSDTRRSRNISKLPIPQHDDRLIMWEMQRPQISPIQPSNSTEAATENFLPLPQHLKVEFDALDDKAQEQFNTALIHRNGLIVEFNELISACLGCNTNVGLLGSEEQSKASLCYLLKYVTKQKYGFAHSASMILHARRHVEQFPSTAEDSSTNQRTGIHLLTRLTKKVTLATEMSSHMAALALLGAPGEYVSCPFQKAFVQEASAYVTNHPTFVESFEDEEEFRALAVDEESNDESELIEEEVADGETDGDFIQEDLFEEDFNPRLQELLGEEECIDFESR